MPALLVLSAVGSCAQSPARALTAAEQMELRTLSGQLADPSRSAKTKLEAAELLLGRPYPQAAEALRGFLERASNRTAQIAVAEAVARHGGGHKDFIGPLMEMLTGEEPTVRAVAARALATYKDHGVTEKLVGIAVDRRRDRAVRLVTIEAMQRVLDKRAVDALVRLLGETDAAVRLAAGEALAKLTNIRHFGPDRDRWNRWWRENKDKDRSEWLADLAESLARSNAALERENTQLRGRLATAMGDLYAATPTGRRDALLLSFLKDALADVRLAGLAITGRRIDAQRETPEEIRSQVRSLLPDDDQRVREAAALITASLGDAAALVVLLERLKVEEAPAVRAGLLKAMGQLRDANALPAVVAELRDSKYESAAASAAAALVRIAEQHPLEQTLRQEAIEALLARYQRVPTSSDGTAAREAVLVAMGAVRDKAFFKTLQGALKDPVATIRLAAVNALSRLGDASSADQLVPLTSDKDRGVRQAAISALGALGGQKHLQTILRRTDADVEADAAVRQQAWEVAMAILAQADVATLRSVSAGLAERADAAQQRIRVMQLLVKALRTNGSDALPSALRELGLELLAVERPAEAAPVLAEAYEAMAAAKDPQAMTVWKDWIAALLAAGDPAVVKAMRQQQSDRAFAQARALLEERVGVLSGQGNWLAVVALGGEAVRELAPRLTADQREALEEMVAQASGKLAEADKKRVAELVEQLKGTDESARGAATGELQSMGRRAVVPLLEELRAVLAAEKLDAAIEGAILDILRQIAPKLTGYDVSAPKPDRIKLVESWLKGNAAA